MRRSAACRCCSACPCATPEKSDIFTSGACAAATLGSVLLAILVVILVATAFFWRWITDDEALGLRDDG